MNKKKEYERELERINKDIRNLEKPKSISFLEILKNLGLFCFVFWPLASGVLFILYGILVLVVDFIFFSKNGSSNIANTLLPFNLFKISGVFWSNITITLVGIMIIATIYKTIIFNKTKKYEGDYKKLKTTQEMLNKQLDSENANAFEKERIKKEKFEKEQIAKGLVKYKYRWGRPEQVKKWKEIDLGINQNFMNISHFQFEEFIARLFNKMGYEAYATKKTGDYGIDVVAKKDKEIIAIQCKQNQIGNNVGNIIVQNTLGSMWKIKANKSIIITTSDFTIQAKIQAREAPVELWNGNDLKKIVREYLIGSDKDET